MEGTYVAISLGTYESALMTFAVAPAPGGLEEGVLFAPLVAYAPHLTAVTAIAADGPTLVTGSSDETIKVYDLATRAEVGRLDQHKGTVTGLCLDSGAKHMISAGEEGAICLWRSKDWEVLKDIDGAHSKLRGVAALSLHPSGKAAVSLGASDGPMVKLWDLTKGRMVWSDKVAGATAVVWDAAGKRFALACGKSIVARKPGNAAGEMMTADNGSEVLCIAAVGADAFAAGCADGKIRVWDFSDPESDTAELTATLDGHTARVKGLSYVNGEKTKDAGLGDAGLLASASSDGRMVVWDCSNWEQLVTKETGCRVTCIATSVVTGAMPRMPESGEPEMKQETEDAEGDNADGDEAEEVEEVESSSAKPVTVKRKEVVIVDQQDEEDERREAEEAEKEEKAAAKKREQVKKRAEKIKRIKKEKRDKKRTKQSEAKGKDKEEESGKKENKDEELVEVKQEPTEEETPMEVVEEKEKDEKPKKKRARKEKKAVKEEDE